MQIKNIQTNISDNRSNVSYKGLDGRKIISTLSNSDSLMTTVALETAVTGGRCINAHKRGGIDELRECAFDNTFAAYLWMKGVDDFNSIGDKIGKNVLKLPTTEFDVGKDALRTPFENLKQDQINKLNDTKEAEQIIKKLSRFKFTKIIASTLLSTSLIGFILPKINQKITKILMLRRKQADIETQNKNSKNMHYTSLEDFEREVTGKKTQSFKGVSEVSHMLENNTICKMLTNDVGIVAGRTVSARNMDEGIEYMFRDISSLFFYFASTPIIYNMLQRLTKSINLTSLDPSSAKILHENLIKQLKNNNGTTLPMSSKEFKIKTFGNLDENSKKIIEKLPFKSDVISLDELKEHIKDKELINKAEKMSSLQPEQAKKGKVLTKQQLEDVFRNGSITESEFMKNIFKKHFGENLTNPYKFISMKKITKFRENIDKYVQAVIDSADKTNKGIVDIEFLQKLNDKNYKMSGKFRAIAMGASALALGWGIPKAQYALTAYRTGYKKPPGFREFDV